MSNKYLPTQFQEYIHMSRYSRWLEDKGRRETWPETVKRYCDFFNNKFEGKFSGTIYNEVMPAILNLEVMPSMRALMTAGPALAKDNLAGYNCAFLAVSKPRHFSEIFYVLLNGTGQGFSCERQFVSQLPEIPVNFIETEETVVVRDSKKGWAEAYRKMIDGLYKGELYKYDTSKVRPAGARLKTFGGRASGPGPLRELFEYTQNLFKGAAGRKLSSIEVHGLVCMIASVVVVGGVRRSALISLSNLSDQRMRDAKSGAWWEDHPEYALANNSIAYTEKPDVETYLQEWTSLVKSKSGERGIFNRVAAQKQAARWGKRPEDMQYGCNPCSEIILRPTGQMCNLSEIVVRSTDTIEDVKRKARIATILGTFQASLTDFKFIGEEWIKNTREEALLGVSMTGVMDNELFSGQLGHEYLAAALGYIRDYTVEVNTEWAEKLGINPATAITCNKPSGTVSCLVDSASGIHTRHAKYYIRTVRTDKKDPLYEFLKAEGVPVEDCYLKPDTTAVFSFPMKAPEGALDRDSLTAIEQLEVWLTYQRHWCHHKPSVTISVKEQEWPEVGAWVWKHFDEVSGVSFLPHSNHTYKQAPYTELSKEDFDKWVEEHPIPELVWQRLSMFELTDSTTGTQNLACTAGGCEVL